MTTKKIPSVAVAFAIVETVREIPEGVPSGHAFAALNSAGISFEQYQAVVDGLVSASILRRSDHILYPGPALAAKAGSSQDQANVFQSRQDQANVFQSRQIKAGK